MAKKMIYLEDAINALDSLNCFGYVEEKWDIVRGIIEHLPAAQPERRRGKWNHGLCSVCGYDWGKDAPIANVPLFCPNCGADMKGEENGKNK